MDGTLHQQCAAAGGFPSLGFPNWQDKFLKSPVLQTRFQNNLLATVAHISLLSSLWFTTCLVTLSLGHLPGTLCAPQMVRAAPLELIYNKKSILPKN